MIVKDKSAKLRRQTVLGGFMLIIIAAVTLEVTALVQYFFSRDGIRNEASQRAESELQAAELEIINVISEAEAAVRNSEWITQWCLNFPDSLPSVTRRVVECNPAVVGSTVALVPGYDPTRPLFAPYSLRNPGEQQTQLLSLATEQYDYPSQEWFTRPVETGEGYWSEPYVDEGGGNMLMTTYSLPIRDYSGQIAAVLTADISLDWLTGMINDIHIYPSAFGMVISRTGRIMVCPPAESLEMRQTIGEAAVSLGDSAAFMEVNHNMLTEENGNVEVKYKGASNHVFFDRIDRTGWIMSIVIPDNEIYMSVKRLGLMVMLLQLVGLAMIVLILRATAKKQREYQELNDRREKMLSELKIASDIQMSMIPKVFPPFPDRKEIDVYASMVPAKEVGGDLYDYYVRDNKLYFVIGDVSGKGIPASLVMAVTRSQFRTVSAHEKSPQRVVSAMNASMASSNDNNMFVTLFCGVLNLFTGHLRYCNAGHNAPFVVSRDSVKALPVVPNLPLGVVPDASFTEQETDLSCGELLFLYTDGLSEAENNAKELFSEERIVSEIVPGSGAEEIILNMEKSVSAFVGDAPQSDDLTMLAIKYMNAALPEWTERHLILHNDIQQIPQLADFIEQIADETRIEQSLAMALNLALEEAVTNVIMYAYPEGSDGLVDIEAILRRNSIEFIITDSGVPFDPTVAPLADVSLPAEQRPIGGLGIYLVRTIMDTLSYERADGKNILSMSKKI